MATSLQNLKYNTDEGIFAVISCDQLAPNVDAVNLPSGTNTAAKSRVTVERAPNNSTTLSTNYAGDLYNLEIEYPIDSTGNYPDVELRFQVGEQEISRLVLSGGYYRNMFPRAHKLVAGAGSRVPLARSMRSAMQVLQKGGKVPNLPLQITGIKLPSSQPFQVIIRSNQGWGNNGTAIKPLRVRIFGDLWTDSELSQFESHYNNNRSFSVTREPSGTISGSHDLPQSLTAKTMDILPNGTDQKHTTAIYRKITSATNLGTIHASDQYILSNKTGVGGQANQVSTRHDLGFEYKHTHDAFIPYEFGFNFDESLFGGGSNPECYVGWWNAANRQTLPDMYTHGVLINGQENNFQYGAVYPQLPQGHLFFPPQAAHRLLNVLVMEDDWAIVASASGLTAINPNRIHAMIGGLEVKHL